MKELKHQWTTFTKGRMRVNACACCGELKLPSNTERNCQSSNVLQSPIVKAGYQLFNDYAKTA